MSVVTGAARQRWAMVAAGTALLLALPSLVALADGPSGRSGPAPDPRALLTRALASAAVPHSGLARSTGTLGLPTLPRLDAVAAVLGGTTRTRVWWAGTRAWRVDVLGPTGEAGAYGTPAGTTLWDYEEDRLTEVTPTRSTEVRLPRPDDLLPPQAGRRLLAAVGPGDRLRVLPRRRSIAGASADGLRVAPADARSTIGHLDVWLDATRGLPLAVELVDRGGATVLRSAFDEVRFGPPPAARLRVPSAPGARRETTDAPDVLTQIQRFSTWRVPDVPAELAGVPSSAPVAGGTVTFGTNLVRFVVVPLPVRLADGLLTATRAAGGVPSSGPDGDSVALASGPVGVVTSRRADRRRAYLVTGAVTPDLLARATAELLAQPRPRGLG